MFYGNVLRLKEGVIKFGAVSVDGIGIIIGWK
jgi:hypothetical protein